MSSPRLKMSGIQKRFGNTVALGGVDLEVFPGEVLALVGENGAGKSTLMKVLSGAHSPDAGQMWLDGTPYNPRNPMDARRAGVAMIYQELSLAPHLSVAENIMLGMEPGAGPMLSWSKMRQIARDAMAQVGRPDIHVGTKVSSLPIADRQLVEIGRAVAVGCRVLVLDEPTSSLSAADIEKLFTLVRRLRSQGQAIVYISHFLEEVKTITDRFTVLRDGQSVGGGKTSDFSPQQIIAMMVGRDVKDLYPRSHRTAGEIVVKIDNLAGKSKPRDASLQLHRGEVLGIAGLVGAGRTEFMRAFFGLDRIKTGQVKVGRFEGSATPLGRWKQRVGMVSEDRKLEGLALGLSIADNISLPKLGFFTSPSQLDASSQKWIKTLAIKCRRAHQPVGDLSGGNQQKVAIARLLHADVDVLLLDEPTRGIDVGAKALIYQTIDELAGQGKAIVMISSYLPELMGVCDRIAVMCRGQLHPARPVQERTEHDIMAEATGSMESK